MSFKRLDVLCRRGAGAPPSADPRPSPPGQDPRRVPV